MATTESVPREQQELALCRSVREKRHCVLTHNNDVGWRTLKSIFVEGSPLAGELTIRSSLPEDDSCPPPGPGDTVGVTFRAGHKKCMFCTELVSRRTGEADATIVLKWPARVQQLRRRVYERATPPPDQVIAVRFWRDTAGTDHAIEAQTVRHGQLEDISCGGLRMKVARAGDLQVGATYKCVFTPRAGKPSILVEGILRHREAIEHGRASLGIQFVGLETTPEGLRTLDRLAWIVSRFQRARSRRSSRRKSNT